MAGVAPLRVGDVVWADGWGPGTIIEMGDRYGDGYHPWVRLSREDRCQCECGHKHSKVETKHADLMHVSRMGR